MYRRRYLCTFYVPEALIVYFLCTGGALFWAQMALAALVAADQGPKKSRFQGTPLKMALVMDIARLKIITYRAIITRGTLIVN
jgi:hypothetical protein